MTPTEIDTNTPFTQNLLRSLVATIPAQPNETDAEYAKRFAAAATAWAAFRPRDTVEQLLAAQIVAAHHSALDCLSQAADTEDLAQADKLRRSHATMARTVRDMMRLLESRQKRPADTQALPAIEPIPKARRRPAEPITTKQPMHRDKAPAAQDEDPTKMTDDELQSGLPEMRTQAAMALFDTKHPMHREALRMLPQILPGIVVPDAMLEDPLPVIA
jgi:hypothetical protein